MMAPALSLTTANSFPIAASVSSSSSNFSGNPFWFAPNLSHFIFSAQVIDRHCFKSNSWILDTRATDHMVHSVSQLTTITSIVHSCVYLPNGEKVVVTHIGTMQISPTLTLTDVLCVPSFNFNLISVSQLTKHKFCCLIFLGD